VSALRIHVLEAFVSVTFRTLLPDAS